MSINDVTGVIIDAAVGLHERLGPGLLETVYQRLLALELARRGLRVERERLVAFDFDGLRFAPGFRIDMLVEGSIVIEVKATESSPPVHAKQLLTYLRLMNVPVGLLLNFGCATMRQGIRRVINEKAPHLPEPLGQDAAADKGAGSRTLPHSP